MIADEAEHQRRLGMQPATGKPVSEPQPQPQADRENAQRRHEAIQLEFHQREPLAGHGLFRHCMIHEQSRQVEQAG